MTDTPVPAVAPRSWTPDAAPGWLRRTLTILAVMSLVPATNALWQTAVAPPTAPITVLTGQTAHDVGLIVAIAAFAALLLAGVLAIGAPHAAVAARVDVAVLVVGLAVAISRFTLTHGTNDEGALTARAATALLRGQPMYGVDWPGVFASHPLTKTMSGSGDYRYGYPPLPALLTAAVTLVHRNADLAATVVTMVALLAATLLLWFLAPSFWRPAVVLVMLGFDQLLDRASGGSPILVAIALLVPVFVRFDLIGRSGHLGRGGVVRAVCLGAACASQQLAWFVAPFVALSLYGLRARELGHRAAALLVLRYTAVAVATFLVIDLPFLVTRPGVWLAGVLLPLTQHAIVHGQGFIDIPYLLTGGSRALDLFSYATAALLVGLLIAVVLFPGRLGPALVILPVSVFLLATRGDFAYWAEFTPLWLAIVATVPLDHFRRAWRPARIDRLPLRLKGGIAALLVAPALVLASVGAFAPAPLSMTLTGTRPVAGLPNRVDEVDLRVANVSSSALTLHFTFRSGDNTWHWWRILRGPRTLEPGRGATYVIAPERGSVVLQAGTAIIAVSDRPMTISNLRLSAPRFPAA